MAGQMTQFPDSPIRNADDFRSLGTALDNADELERKKQQQAAQPLAATAEDTKTLAQTVASNLAAAPTVPAAAPAAPGIARARMAPDDTDAQIKTLRGKLDSLQGQINDEMDRTPDPSKRDAYEEQLSSLRDRMDEANRLYRNRADKAELAQAVQGIANAITQFGAASVGARTGTNMADLNLSKSDVDYDKRIDRYGRELNEQRQQVRDQMQDVLSARRDARGDQKDQLNARVAGLRTQATMLDNQLRDYMRLKGENAQAAAREAGLNQRADLSEKGLALREKLAADKAAQQDAAAKQKHLQDMQKQLGSKKLTPEAIQSMATELGLPDKPGRFWGTNPPTKEDVAAELGRRIMEGGTARPVSVPQAPTAPAAPAGPRPGTIQGGYRFKGGDPADKQNWEKI